MAASDAGEREHGAHALDQLDADTVAPVRLEHPVLDGVAREGADVRERDVVARTLEGRTHLKPVLAGEPGDGVAEAVELGGALGRGVAVGVGHVVGQLGDDLVVREHRDRRPLDGLLGGVRLGAVRGLLLVIVGARLQGGGRVGVDHRGLRRGAVGRGRVVAEAPLLVGQHDAERAVVGQRDLLDVARVEADDGVLDVRGELGRLYEAVDLQLARVDEREATGDRDSHEDRVEVESGLVDGSAGRNQGVGNDAGAPGLGVPLVDEVVREGEVELVEGRRVRRVELRHGHHLTRVDQVVEVPALGHEVGRLDGVRGDLVLGGRVDGGRRAAGGGRCGVGAVTAAGERRGEAENGDEAGEGQCETASAAGTGVHLSLLSGYCRGGGLDEPRGPPANVLYFTTKLPKSQ